MEKLDFEFRYRNSNLPEYARSRNKFRDDTANGLTKCVLTFLKIHGKQGERVAPTGRMVDQTQKFTDTLGYTRRIGSTKYIKSSMQPGSADISAIVNGRAIKIEVKMPGDRQSEKQKIYQTNVESAGGIYLIVRNFTDFVEWYENFITL
ncbi:MAG: hypothetical protein ACOC2M_02190 [bacterium]